MFSDLRVRVAVPIWARRRAAGAILLGSKQSGKMYSSHDAQFLAILSSQVAVSMKNARLFKDRDQRVRELVALSRTRHDSRCRHRPTDSD